MRFQTSFDVSTRAPTPEQPRIRFRMQDHARRLSGRPLRRQVDSPRVEPASLTGRGSGCGFLVQPWRPREQRRDAVYGPCLLRTSRARSRVSRSRYRFAMRSLFCIKHSDSHSSRPRGPTHKPPTKLQGQTDKELGDRTSQPIDTT